MSEELEQPEEILDSESGTDGVHDDENLGADPDSQEQPEPEEEEEIDIGDEKLALPKGLAAKVKAGVMMHADYTQKTQAIAEERKAVQAEREQNQRNHTEYVQEVAKVVSIDEQIKAYQGALTRELIASDPITAMQYQNDLRTLEGQRQQAVASITQKQQANALAEQQSTAKQVQEAEAYIKREIPAWTPQRTEEISAFIKASGADPASVWKAVFQQPALAKVLHKAEMYDKAEKKAAAVAKPKAAPQEKPVTRIGANRQTAKPDPARMSADEWAKQRNAEIAKRNKR